MPETCWAVFKWQVINLKSCCILLVDSVESMMMHGLANPKSHLRFGSLWSYTSTPHTCLHGEQTYCFASFFYHLQCFLSNIKLLKLYGISSQLCCSEKNVKLCLCSIKHYTMKTWGSGGRAPHTCNLCTTKVNTCIHTEKSQVQMVFFHISVPCSGLIFWHFRIQSSWKLKLYVPLKCHILSTT
jgi:hypothetical protein